MPGPLAGLRVLELARILAGPWAGQILADLGADVVKVENPGKGDYGRDWGPPFSHGTSTLFHVLNHNKRGLALDLRDRMTCERMKAFSLDHADVVIQNMRPGAIDKRGLGAEALRAQKPELIYCDLGAYGRSGPLRDRPGYDPLMQALQGATSTSTTNADGSTTTSLTYADGSKVTMTSAASASASGAATSSYNFIEQMIAREAKAISSSTTASLSVSV